MVFHSFRLTDDTMAPVWAYVVLAIGIATMSSGGVWFALLVETPPLMQACWRLTLTAVLQTFGVFYELRTDPTIIGVAFQLRFIKAIPLVMALLWLAILEVGDGALPIHPSSTRFFWFARRR
ncbi:hypothetical protein LEN26_000657 [Aphanomyces euteiches]|nr:hypothetical protein AeMF1_000582 [Aphanomyces euteiches]KAH9163082.1 hypothetical protein LEN26_000657 [Aphanomyces euteiches]KAH9196167.1 hypothetical protein AeNC1_001870 [Aphanomyces euteiches]